MLCEVRGYSFDPGSDAETIFKAIGLVSTCFWNSCGIDVWVR
jgi:hypothetical protein